MTFTLSTYEAERDLRRLNGDPFQAKNRRPRLARYTPDHRPPTSPRLVRVRPTPSTKGQWTIEDGTFGRFYLAGPMRGYPLSNFPAFLMAARILTARGFEILSPAEKDIEAGFDPSRPAEDQNFDVGAAFRWDFENVVKSDGVILMPGWEHSTGAKAERVVAQLSELDVYLLDENYNLTEAPELDYRLEWVAKPTVVKP